MLKFYITKKNVIDRLNKFTTVNIYLDADKNFLNLF